jgi:hypothetical protein
VCNVLRNYRAVFLAGQAGAFFIFHFSLFIFHSFAPAWTGNLMSGLAFARLVELNPTFVG